MPPLSYSTGLCLAAACFCAATTGAFAQEASQNEVNNPLTPKITIFLQDYYVGDLAGTQDKDANKSQVQGLFPHQIGGPNQLFRFTLPLVTTPTEAGQATDLGDLTLLDVFPFRAGRVELGIGPLFVLPTATDRATGAGEWQAGAAGVLIAPQTQGLLGALVTYQHSFAGPQSRADVSLMTVQPLIIYNLPRGWYLRSTAIWVADFVGDGSYIPIGFGVGKVIQTAGPTVNLYVEPQVTAWKADGLGIPKWQVLVGVTLQFPLHRH
jgi:hypothetical protein